MDGHEGKVWMKRRLSMDLNQTKKRKTCLRRKNLSHRGSVAGSM
jgi:hypothetical protein